MGSGGFTAGPINLPDDGIYRFVLVTGDPESKKVKLRVDLDHPKPSTTDVHESPGSASLSGSITLGDGTWLDETSQLAADESLVELAPGAIAEEVAAELDATLVARHGRWARLRRASGAPLGLAATPEARTRVVALLRDAARHPRVRRAQPNHVRAPLTLPDDPLYAKQWDLPASGFGPAAWGLEDGDPLRAVAVLDTGVVKNHVDLYPRLTSGMDFVSDAWNAGDGDGMDGDPSDPFLTVGTHGTHVSGTVAAVHDNGAGIAGAAREGLVVPVRVLGVLGGTDFDIAQGILYAAGLPNLSGATPPVPVDVINMSLGGPNHSAILDDAVAQAAAAGVVVVAAAGNTNSAKPMYPAAFDQVFAVAATNLLDERAYYSSFGPHVDIAAPGGNTKKDKDSDGDPDGVLSCVATYADGSTWTHKAGTSMAAPHVAAAAFLLRSARPELPRAVVEAYLAAGARDLGDPGLDPLFGHGLLDAYRSLSLLLDEKSGPPELYHGPDVLRFQDSADLLELAVLNLGGGVVQVSAVESDSFWLIPIDQHAVAPGTLRVSANKVGLLKGEYHGTLTLHTNVGEREVPVVMVVGEDGPIVVSRVYVVIYDAISDISVGVIEVTNSNADAFTGLDLPEGTYRVVASTDLDYDGVIGEDHDYTAEFHDDVTGKPKLVLIDGHLTSGVDLEVSGVGGAVDRTARPDAVGAR